MTTEECNQLAALLYPDVTTLPADMEKLYPPRNLPEGAKVTRFAPSPTGFVHFGSLFPTRVSERLAHQSGGIFILRIEDTDAKREAEGAAENLIQAYARYGIHFDEGAVIGGNHGDYGPYRQSERAKIYQTYGKELVRQGKAYPCFCTEEELSAIRAEQEELKVTPGYYGKWAKWRDASLHEIQEKLAAGASYVLRFRSEGSAEHHFKFTDLVKGTVEVTENEIDHVLLKSDGIPTYHFAHAVDEHLMHVTHVVRGEEWLPSLPLHIQLHQALGFRLPKYMHISQLMKLENGAKKKLSKRDHEAGLDFYQQSGYAADCVVEYVMTLLNSNYEEWRTAHPDASFDEFPFSIKKMSPSGCLFDLNKLNDVSRNTIARMTADQVYKGALTWAEEYDVELAGMLKKDQDYAKRILSIGRGGAKPRKDFAVWADVKPYLAPFYEETFCREASWPAQFAKKDIAGVLQGFLTEYGDAETAESWFAGLKRVVTPLGFAPEVKQYKADPTQYKGHIGDASSFVRIAVTGRVNSPDLYEVMQILGASRVRERVAQAIASLQM